MRLDLGMLVWQVHIYCTVRTYLIGIYIGYSLIFLLTFRVTLQKQTKDSGGWVEIAGAFILSDADDYLRVI